MINFSPGKIQIWKRFYSQYCLCLSFCNCSICIVLICFRKEKGLNAKLLEDLNAWNAKWLDQPDFDRRLDAFKEIQKMNSLGQITVEQGVIIIYTCFHFVRVVSFLVWFLLKIYRNRILHTVVLV